MVENEQHEQQNRGLDLKDTLTWYKKHNIDLPKIPIDKDLPYPIENQELIGLSAKELGGLFSLFPENAKQRSILKKVIGQPTTWFHKESTEQNIKTTTNPADAISPTAFVPSYTNYTPWKETKVPAVDIWLHKIPEKGIPEEVRKTILAQGFVHEVAHTIVQPALYIDNYKLKFPDGKILDAVEIKKTFTELAEQYLPISEYASTYRGENNKFTSSKPGYDAKNSLSEEMCETIASHLLDFAYTGQENQEKNPLASRPEIKQFIEDFLNAKLVKE